MQKRQLGASTLQISELSLGGMSLPTDLSAAKYVVDAALDAGINYFDTADLYDRGQNEEIYGELLKKQRAELIIATKVGNRWQEGVDGWQWDPSPQHIKEAVHKSLARLQTDYIDVYQLHGGTIADPWDEMIDTFESLKKEGLIREYGISSIRPNVFTPFSKNSAAISNMMQFNILDQCAMEWFEALHEHGVSVVTRGSIAKGLLTSEWSARLKDYMNYSKDELATIIPKIEAQFGDIHAAALAFNLQFPQVASTVIGARTMQQLTTTIEAYEKSKALQGIEQILTFTKQDKYNAHR